METIKFELLGKTPVEALSKAFKDGFMLAHESAETHFIVEYLLKEPRRWKAILQIIYEPGTAYRDGHTHLFIRKEHEYAYRPQRKDFQFDYVHVLEDGSFWETILQLHPDLALYEAAHDSRQSGDSDGSGDFVLPTLVQKPMQAFIGKFGPGPGF